MVNFRVFYQVFPIKKLEFDAKKCAGGKSKNDFISCDFLITLQIAF